MFEFDLHGQASDAMKSKKEWKSNTKKGVLRGPLSDSITLQAHPPNNERRKKERDKGSVSKEKGSKKRFLKLESINRFSATSCPCKQGRQADRKKHDTSIISD
mmetsp:Transcript_20892/g.41660  ORF Transcript_20892/g.41660 Transcript_20892/m.41660 type:complete len:103 (-) Transcript_20892:183-491(-)